MSPPFSVPLLSPYLHRRLFSAVVLREYLTRCVLCRLVLTGVIGLWKWVSYQAVACDWQIRIDWLLQCSDCHNRMDVQGRSGDVTHKAAPLDSCNGSLDAQRPAPRFTAVELRNGCLSSSHTKIKLWDIKFSEFFISTRSLIQNTSVEGTHNTEHFRN